VRRWDACFALPPREIRQQRCDYSAEVQNPAAGYISKEFHLSLEDSPDLARSLRIRRRHVYRSHRFVDAGNVRKIPAVVGYTQPAAYKRPYFASERRFGRSQIATALPREIVSTLLFW
jgi:hypothetical protein